MTDMDWHLFLFFAIGICWRMVFRNLERKKIESGVLFDVRTIMGCRDRNYHLKIFGL